MRATAFFSIVLALSLLLPASLATAQGGDDTTIHGVRIDVHGNLGYQQIGAGFRVDIPIVPDGFLRHNRIRDELALSPGVDLMFLAYARCRDDGGPGPECHHRVGVWPLLVAQWNIYLNDRWSVFPELGIAFLVNSNYYGRWNREDDPNFWVSPAAGVGARWHFSPRSALLLRMSVPAGFQLGITF